MVDKYLLWWINTKGKRNKCSFFPRSENWNKTYALCATEVLLAIVTMASICSYVTKIVKVVCTGSYWKGQCTGSYWKGQCQDVPVMKTREDLSYNLSR